MFSFLSLRKTSWLVAAVVLLTACLTTIPPRIEITSLSPDQASQMAQDIRKQVSAELAEGLELNLWASDSLVADPIALKVDTEGRIYISRTERQKNSEFDIRGYRHWMTRSISWETVEDRKAFLHSFFSPDSSEENSWLPDLNGDSLHDWKDLAVQQEKIYRIEDTDGDGFADQTQLFYEGFHEEVTDVAGAILPFGKDLYVGVAPDLWKLTDTDQDGWADEKESLSHGYAIHIGFSGHGMSGLTYGPDGRIYWSIGDIGFSIEDDKGNKHHYPNQGGIFRANPDGSDLEVFAVGLRNTHEFAFDKYGNLISVDNDGDHPGEKERIVYVVEGSDAGWRANWQYGKYTDPNNNAYKVWMDEEYFKERWDQQAAHLVPPVLNYHSGPTSILYNPGTALGPKWSNRFIMGEFTGTPARSHVYAFDLQPKGAGFEFKGEEMMVGGILATGMDFGPDGSLYMADWIDGWGTKDYGRIWKLDVPADSVASIRRETQELIQTNFTTRPVPDLVNWLSHDDMRIRLKAQFELATRADRGETGFLTALSHKDHQLARVHAVWGLGQMIRQDDHRGEKLLPWLEDEDPEIRAQVAKTIGDAKVEGAGPALIELLADESARVRFFAAEALGRLKATSAIQPLLQMLEVNQDEDVYLRHAGALALSRIGQADPLLALSESPSRALRIAAVVALRRMNHAGVAKFLNDTDEFVVTNAARAIHDDWSIPGALPELARQLEAPTFTNEPYLRRVINANFRLGETEHLKRLSNFVSQTDVPDAMRAEALACLATWPKPSVLDRVVGRNRGLQPRESGPLLAEISANLENWLADEQAEVLVATTDLMSRLEVAEASDQLMALLSSHPKAEVRMGALSALGIRLDSVAGDAARMALQDRESSVRAEALSMVNDLNISLEEKTSMLDGVLKKGSVAEQQRALQSLAELPLTETEAILGRSLDRLASGRLAPELELDLSEWVANAGSDSLQNIWAEIEAKRAEKDPLAEYAVALEGGDVNQGRQLFYRHEAAQCVRCHAIGEYGGNVGPNLLGIASKYDRQHLLEALVAPSAYVAPGYGMVSLELKNGDKPVGTLIKETATEIQLQTEIKEPLRIPKGTVVKRTDAPSSMPNMGLILSKREIRDLVAFLHSLSEES